MSERKGFLRHFAVIGVGTALNLLLGLVTTPMITRIVDPEEYGRHGFFLLYANLALRVLVLGMDQGLGRFYYLNPDKAYRRALLFRCVRYPFLLTAAAIVLAAAGSLTGRIPFEFSPLIMGLLCMYTLLSVLYTFGLNVNRLEYDTKMYSTLNMLLKGSYAGLALPLLLLVKGQDLLILCIASTGSILLVTLVSILAKRSMWDLKANRDAECTVSEAELLRYALPFTVTMGVTYLFQTLDRLAIKHYCTYAEVGVYTSAMSLVTIFAIVQTTFNTLWAPMAIEHYTKDPEDRTFYQKGNQVITVVMFFLGLSLILVKDVFALLLGPKYREAALFLPFLIYHPIMYTISETTATGINIAKKTKYTIIIAGASCLMNFVGNTLLVPRLGGQGAAISTGLSYILFFALRTYYSNRYFPVDFKLKRFALLTAATTAYALYNTFFRFTWITLVGYLVSVLTLAALYRDTVRWGLEYGVEKLKALRVRKG